MNLIMLTVINVYILKLRMVKYYDKFRKPLKILNMA